MTCHRCGERLSFGGLFTEVEVMEGKKYHRFCANQIRPPSGRALEAISRRKWANCDSIPNPNPIEGKDVVRCLSCNQEVAVKKIDYGGGKIATCPKCDKLAYSGS